MQLRYSGATEQQQGAKWILIATLVLAAVIETHWPTLLLFGGAKPDLMLLLVLYFAFSENPAKATGIGFIGGFLEDMLSAGPLGLNIFCKVLLGYTVGLVSTRLVTEHPIVITTVAFLSTICQVGLVILLSFLYRDHVPVKFMFLHVGVPMAFYTSLLAPVCFYCMDRLRKRIESRTGGGRREGFQRG